MTELRTLKDIDLFELGNSEQQAWTDETLKDIKAEAVKEIKVLDNHYESNKIFPFMFAWAKEREILKKYIMWKNNLTEEDLK